MKFLAIVILVAATAICTIVAVMAGVEEAYLIMGLAWLCSVLVALNILGTGIALTHVRKLEKKVARLEQQLIQPPVPQYTYRGESSYENIKEGIREDIPAASVGEPAPEAVPAPVPTPAPKKKGAGLWIALAVIALVVVVGVLAVIFFGGKNEAPGESLPGGEMDAPAAEEPCAITVNGICVDESYVDDEGSSLKLVYLFYTIHAESSNLQIDSKYTTMRIGENAYESDNFADVAAACKYTTNYYYGSYIRDVYVGESMNVVATFYIPQAELESGNTVTLEDHQIPGAEQLVLNTADFMYFSNSDEIAIAMDPEGYEMGVYLREEADWNTAEQVKSQMNGYYWSFYVNSTSYEIEFAAPNSFTVRTSLGTSKSGTYSIRNGFVFCTYPDTGYTVEIPYTLVDGNLELDVVEGFDVMG